MALQNPDIAFVNGSSWFKTDVTEALKIILKLIQSEQGKRKSCIKQNLPSSPSFSVSTPRDENGTSQDAGRTRHTLSDLVGQPIAVPFSHHNAAKERNREAVKFLVENGAFLPDDMHDCRFNPPIYYCHGLKWAYEEMKQTLSSGESFRTSES